MNTSHSLLIVLVVTVMTLATRALPFLIFGGKKQPPKTIMYLGRVLPCAIMAMLVVYCLKNVSLTAWPHGIPEAIGVALAAALHVWKRNTLLSIAASTVVYMLLVQLVF
ncbi:MAG: branched-chain amino acid transporter AzlD [Ruminococcaceae bacterium]|nr:branched-chain amino acid transporter AzlD [Oscillospiraceae bacterium]